MHKQRSVNSSLRNASRIIFSAIRPCDRSAWLKKWRNIARNCSIGAFRSKLNKHRENVERGIPPKKEEFDEN